MWVLLERQLQTIFFSNSIWNGIYHKIKFDDLKLKRIVLIAGFQFMSKVRDFSHSLMVLLLRYFAIIPMQISKPNHDFFKVCFIKCNVTISCSVFSFFTDETRVKLGSQCPLLLVRWRINAVLMMRSYKVYVSKQKRHDKVPFLLKGYEHRYIFLAIGTSLYEWRIL